MIIVFVTARKQSLRRLCFYTCLSVILFTVGGSTWAGTPPGQEPPRAGTPLPPSRYTPLGRYTPTPSKYTPAPQQVHPRGQVHPPWEGTSPPGKIHPPWAGTPPREQYMLGDTGNKRVVRILLECILVCFFFGNDNPCQLTTCVTVFPVDFQRLFYFLCSALIIKQGLVV